MQHALAWLLMMVMPAPQVRRAPPLVRPGLEVLLVDSLHLVRGKRVGVVTNATGVDRAGRSGVDRLREAGIAVVALFSPEHGFRGAAAPGAAVAGGTDSLTGLPIYSLYGATLAPTPAMLAGLDLLVIDLQDVGARYYTYISTALEVMRAAAAAHMPVVLLDRPNPIGGLVQGAVLDGGARSFVGKLAVPMRHGLTIGELARLGNDELALGADLTVVPVAGWRRRPAFEATGLPFVPPSPNLRALEALWHYPGLCLFEGTNLSVGRGSDAPFEQVGAAWLDADSVLAVIDHGLLRGVRVERVRFTPHQPGDGKSADTTVTGLRLHVTDRRRYDPTATAVALLAAIHAAQPARLRIVPAQFDRLAGGPSLREALLGGTAARTIVQGWGPARAAWRGRIAPYLLYDSR